MSDYQPTPEEIAELRAAVLYSYQAGEPDLSSIASDWVRGIVSQPDGGLVEVIDALAVAREAIEVVQTAHESQLTRMAKERARLQRKVDRLTAELEAAQSPPLGYVTLIERDPTDQPSLGRYWCSDTFDDRDAAEQTAINSECEAAEIGKQVRHIIAEVREVQP